MYVVWHKQRIQKKKLVPKRQTNVYFSTASEYHQFIHARPTCVLLCINTKVIVYKSFVELCISWQYGLWSFHTGGTKLEIFLPKNQHTQRKLLNFKNWGNGEMSKSANLGAHLLLSTFFDNISF